MSQKLQRLSDKAYALVDSELAIICANTCCMADVQIIGLAFKTRSAGWRCLRRALVDIGNRPDEQQAIKRILEDAAGLPQVIHGEPFEGYSEARHTLQAGGDIGHRTALHMLALAIACIDHLHERRYGQPPAVDCSREVAP